MKFKTLTLPGALAFLMLISCNTKTEQTRELPVPERTIRQKLMSTPWGLMSIKASYVDSNGKIVEEERIDAMTPCERDDILSFLDVGYIEKWEIKKCDSTSENVWVIGKWQLTNDFQLMTKIKGNEVTDSIIELEDHYILKLKRSGDTV